VFVLTVGYVKSQLAAIALVLGLGLAAPVAAGAAPGDLDPTFSDDGVATTQFGGRGAVANDMAIDSQGRIVAAGLNNRKGTHDDITLARYLPNGAPDPSFSGDGRLQTSFTFQESANAVAIDSQGRIITAGAGGGGFFFARFLPNGRLDHSFSGDGRCSVKAGNGFGAYDMALDDRGRIVAVGFDSVNDDGNSDFIVARLNPDGTLDRSFHSNGRARIDFGAPELATSVAIDSLGRIVVGGVTVWGVRDGFALARLLPNGSLDPSFSGDGRQITPFGPRTGPSSVNLASIAIDEHNRVVAAGDAYSGTGTQVLAVARYRTDGSLDPSFSDDGKTLTTFGWIVAGSVTIDPAGRIVVAGYGPPGGDLNRPFDLKLVRYDPAGDLDTSFGGDGRIETDLPGHDFLTAVTIDSQDRIVGGGRVGGNFAVVRFLGGP
jgi:uncharacterized delta-60 repeat protein